MRILAAVYGWLAWRSGKAAIAPKDETIDTPSQPAGRSNGRELMIHLKTAKAILFSAPFIPWHFLLTHRP